MHNIAHVLALMYKPYRKSKTEDRMGNQKKEKEITWVHETVTSGSRYPVRPDDVPMNHRSSDVSTFGTAECEEVAGHLLSFFKSRGYWCSFTLDELHRYYIDQGWNPNSMLYGLCGGYIHFGGAGFELYYRPEPLVVFMEDGTCFVTNHFIDRCVSRTKNKE
ncbi:MAG: hypothetical protein Q8R25_04445 [bacterium]|nr:hypothetical protein [bacterium]